VSVLARQTVALFQNGFVFDSLICTYTIVGFTILSYISECQGRILIVVARWIHWTLRSQTTSYPHWNIVVYLWSCSQNLADGLQCVQGVGKTNLRGMDSRVQGFWVCIVLACYNMTADRYTFMDWWERPSLPRWLVNNISAFSEVGTAATDALVQNAKYLLWPAW